MKRPFWQRPSAKILEQLAPPPCQEYLRLTDELLHLDDIWGPHVLAYGWDMGITEDPEFISTVTELRRAHDALDRRQRTAVKKSVAITLANRRIEAKIESIWTAKGLRADISDIATENMFIEIMHLKYVYPDYAELVGPPTETDFRDLVCRDGLSKQRRLTVERKADLLLLGVLPWKGMHITRIRADSLQEGGGWLVFTGRRYKPINWLGCYFHGYDGLVKIPDLRTKDVTFMPYLNHETRWLHDFLINCDIELGNRPARTKFQRVRFHDKNPYNCLPNNLTLVEKRGRRMRCGGCGSGTTAEESMVFSGKGRKIRLCLNCARNTHSILL